MITHYENRNWTDDELLAAVNALQTHGQQRPAAKSISISQAQLCFRLKHAAKRGLVPDSTDFDFKRGNLPILDEAATDLAKPAIDQDELRETKEWLDVQIEKGKKTPFAVIVTLTPALAQLLLDINPKNRPINARNKSAFKSDLIAVPCRVEFNGESVIVSNTGTLNDGQHRCEVVEATGICYDTVIVFGPKESSRFTVDTGVSKTAAALCAMNNQVYAGELSAAAKNVIDWKERNQLSSQSPITRAQVVEESCRNEDLKKSVSFVGPICKKIRNHAILAFCHYVFSQRSGRQNADDFIRQLCLGAKFDNEDDPILYTRDRLPTMTKWSACERAELIFRTWNLFRKGIKRAGKINVVGGKLPEVSR